MQATRLLWYSILLAIKYVGGGWRKFNGNNKHDKPTEEEVKRQKEKKLMSMASCERMICASFSQRCKCERDWVRCGMEKGCFSMPKCIECCDLLCGVWLKWKSNPWTVLGIRSRQYCNSFNGYSPAVYFPFFSVLCIYCHCLTQSYQFRSSVHT